MKTFPRLLKLLFLYAFLPATDASAWELALTAGYMLPSGDVGSGRVSPLDSFIDGNTTIKASLGHKVSKLIVGGYLQGGRPSGGCVGTYRNLIPGCKANGSQFSLGPEVKFEVDKWQSVRPWASIGAGVSRLHIEYEYEAHTVEQSGSVFVKEKYTYLGFELPLQIGFVYKFTESWGLGLSAQLAPGMFTNSEHCYSDCELESFSYSQDDAWYFWYGGGLTAMFALQ